MFAGVAAGSLLAPAPEVFTVTGAQAQEALGTEIAYGVYDPPGSFSGAYSLSFEHGYFPWLAADLLPLRDVDNYARQRNPSLQIKLETHSRSPGRYTRPEQLLDNNLSGLYAETINEDSKDS